MDRSGDASARAGVGAAGSPGERGLWEADVEWGASDWGRWRSGVEGSWNRARGVGAVPAEQREAREVAAARERYEAAVREGGRVSRKAVSGGFEEEREKTFAEYRESLTSVGCPDVLEAVGMDVVAFIQGWWLPNHEKNFRTVVEGENKKVASASAVKAVIGHVAKSYSMLGVADAVNPAKSEAVRSYREGYRNELHERGVREKRAKIMSESKVTQLVEHLNREVRSRKGISRCCAAMDRAAVLYLWETWARGKECGTVEAGQVDVADSIVRPGWSKTIREEPSAEIRVRSGAEPNTFIWAAGLLTHEMSECSVAPGRGYLFRPLTRRKDGFLDESLSAGAMNRRVQRHMQRAGMHNGETLHSFRRSAVQHAAELEGYDVERLMSLGRWKSKSAFRIYVEEIAGAFARGSM
ncbi:putative Phage_integrase [Klebsormidium nitens]|uniref:Putative Phage_integrase n=1 Tax=Klebsormidium nitens TaxID=105231 RepID=A0A1Y1IG09_KLENI|nr:putative Phage_integrase [Klebsormidium nitens]|eukprot:GAQ88041.1 putative Phage_integrase [Klebsormidium nitens]